MNEQPTLNKQRLCRQVAQHTGHSTRLVTEIVEALLETLEAHLVAAGRVEFQNLFVLEMMEKRRRQVSKNEYSTYRLLKVRMGQRLRNKLQIE